ncbi:MAG: hypothetical protein WEE64_01855 [Dehalococcoidia bacterium]
MAPDAQEGVGLPFVVHGVARLPKSICGESPACLLVELVLDAEDQRVLDVAAMPSLPGYAALLKRVLAGCSLDRLEQAGESFAERYRGPLLRPTLAAVANAALNWRNQRDQTTHELD